MLARDTTMEGTPYVVHIETIWYDGRTIHRNCPAGISGHSICYKYSGVSRPLVSPRVRPQKALEAIVWGMNAEGLR